MGFYGDKTADIYPLQTLPGGNLVYWALYMVGKLWVYVIKLTRDFKRGEGRENTLPLFGLVKGERKGGASPCLVCKGRESLNALVIFPSLQNTFGGERF